MGSNRVYLMPSCQTCVLLPSFASYYIPSSTYSIIYGTRKNNPKTGPVETKYVLYLILSSFVSFGLFTCVRWSFWWVEAYGANASSLWKTGSWDRRVSSLLPPPLHVCLCLLTLVFLKKKLEQREGSPSYKTQGAYLLSALNEGVEASEPFCMGARVWI